MADELPGAFVARADLADPAQVEALVKQLQEVAGRVDVLVNNAGFNRDAPIFSMKLDDYDAVAGLARGTWYLTKLVLRRFMLRTGGRIINISSVVGHTGNAGQIPYTMVEGRPRRPDQVARAGAAGPGHPRELGGAGLHRHRDDRRAARRGPEPDPGARSRSAAWAGPRRWPRSWPSSPPAASYVTGSVVHVNGGMYGG